MKITIDDIDPRNPDAPVRMEIGLQGPEENAAGVPPAMFVVARLLRALLQFIMVDATKPQGGIHIANQLPPLPNRLNGL